MRGYITGTLIVGLSLALLWHFSNIWLYGQHIIQEPNKTILIAETILLLGILIFGFYIMITELKRRATKK